MQRYLEVETGPDHEDEDHTVDQDEDQAAPLCRHHGELEEAGEAQHQARDGGDVRRVFLISWPWWRLRQQ